ncbi:MAG TPA: response regulator [Methanospirillum sp.]|nr:response regulator [Methanospirillum sp.]
MIPHSGKPFLVLLVEDNDDHAELVIRSLEEHRVANHLIRLSNGEEALDYLHRTGQYSDPVSSPYPDLILLDLRLPKIDGLEVLRQIKESENLRNIPVVIMTSSGAERDISMAYDQHANSYVVKPVDFLGFTKMMEDLGFYWLGWNAKPFEKP